MYVVVINTRLSVFKYKQYFIVVRDPLVSETRTYTCKKILCVCVCMSVGVPGLYVNKF